MQPRLELRRLSPEMVNSVAPALEAYTQGALYADLWQREGASARDRSLVTVTALIAKGQFPALGYYLNQALDHGLTPAEISELITHLAFYAGWGNAMGATGAAQEVFSARGVSANDIPPASVDLLPLDEAADAQRHRS